MDKVSLLRTLKIERSEAPKPRLRHRAISWRWPLALAVLALVAALVIWFGLARPDQVMVHVTSAQATRSESVGGSLLDASGYVVPRRQATVSSKITGKVVEVLIEEGQHVQAGQVMARLDDSNARAALAQAVAQVSSAEAEYRVARFTFEQAGPKDARNQRLYSEGYLSVQAAEDSRGVYETARLNMDLAQQRVAAAAAGVQAARQNVDDTVVRAPFNGVVTVKAAQPGEIVSPISAGGGFIRTGIGTVVDMDSLEVEVDVAENFINRVRQGMAAQVKLNAYPDWTIPGRLIAVVPTADRSKATVSVRVELQVNDPRIVPEMGARVAFLDSLVSGAPAVMGVKVPFSAVRPDGPDRGVVMLVRSGRLERRGVRLGGREGDDQILLTGVRPGDQLVAGDLDALHDGQSVKVARKAGDTH